MGAVRQVEMSQVQVLEAALERQVQVSEADTAELVVLEEMVKRLELRLSEAEEGALEALRVRATLEARVRELEGAVAVRDAQYTELARGALKLLRHLKGGAQ